MSHPVPFAPSPWSTKSECYWLLLNLSELPDGVYDPLEMGCLGKENGQFKGGLGTIMIVRYRDTPVGPYDELIFIPGSFAIPKPTTTDPPKLPKKALRITRIYVSQRTTTYNGRFNWNIPKHLARFRFSAPPTPTGASPPVSLTVEVYPPTSQDGDGVVPFFAATLRPWRWVPAIPTSTRYMPLSTMHAQPPLPGASSESSSGSEEGVDAYSLASNASALLIGTESWRTFAVDSYSPRSRGCWVAIHAPGSTQGVGINEEERMQAQEYASKFWPVGVRPWRIGAWMEDAEMTIHKPVEFKL